MGRAGESAGQVRWRRARGDSGQYRRQVEAWRGNRDADRRQLGPER